MGAVARPGPVQIETEKPATVTRAISMAGGFQRFARQAKVQLLRDGTNTTVNVEAILNGQSGDAGKGSQPVEDPQLKPGDVVFVPESLF